MKGNEILTKWWFWVIFVVFIISTYIFIIAMSYSIHPTEIRLYANDQMVATSQGLVEQLKITGFNTCHSNCKTEECYWSCENFYDNETTIGCSTELGYNQKSFEQCFDKLTKCYAGE
jgi:hypothetical protein